MSDRLHTQKSTKMGFPGNPPKIIEIRQNRKSSKMVVWGWYMTHFDRRDCLMPKKIDLDDFRILPDLQDPICEFADFFLKISIWAEILWKSSAGTFDFDFKSIFIVLDWFSVCCDWILSWAPKFCSRYFFGIWRFIIFVICLLAKVVGCGSLNWGR